jgi:Tol biopolymer transport system component
MVSICLLVYWFLAHRVAAHPIRVFGYLQITHDGHDKYLSGTDGSRLYFTQRSPQLGEQVAISGGSPAPVPIPIPNSWVGDVSPDGSTVFIISEAGGMTSANTLWTSAVLGGSLRRLASAVSSTWSPDGNSLVYATQEGEIYTMRSDGAQPNKLASVGGFVDSLSWSPDGQYLRFFKDGKLWQISSHGDGLHELLSEWRNASPKVQGRFGTDGRFFFICDGQIWTLDERHTLFGAASVEPVVLTSGPIRWTDPIPGKDGRKLFAVGATRRGELVRFDSQSGKFQPFLGGISAEYVDFSKDGKSLLYVSYPDGILWRTNRDRGVPVQLTSPPVYPKLPRWSPDGKQIAFVDQSPQGASAIYTIPSEGGAAPSRLLPDDRQPETDPGWSPDGSSIVFSTSPEQFNDPRPVLRIFDTGSRKVANIPGSEGLYSPRWSPDGKFIAASTVDSLAMKLFNVATGQWSQLNTGPVAFPNWSSDSRSIEYLCWLDDPVVRRIPLDGGKPQVVAPLGGEQYTGFYTSWMGLDPADSPLTLLDRGTKDIYALSLSSK